MDQLAVARETFMFEARIGSVGPVILCLALIKFYIMQIHLINAFNVPLIRGKIYLQL